MRGPQPSPGAREIVRDFYIGRKIPHSIEIYTSIVTTRVSNSGLSTPNSPKSCGTAGAIAEEAKELVGKCQISIIVSGLPRRTHVEKTIDVAIPTIIPRFKTDQLRGLCISPGPSQSTSLGSVESSEHCLFSTSSPFSIFDVIFLQSLY